MLGITSKIAFAGEDKRDNLDVTLLCSTHSDPQVSVELNIELRDLSLILS